MKFTKKGTWGVSVDSEIFYDEYDTKKAAIESVLEEYGAGYVGEIVKIEFTADDFYCDIEERLSELLFDEIGDASEMWELPIADERELIHRMGETMVKFLNEKNLQPMLYKVINIEKVEED